jgi:hypothetical protein
MIEERAEATKGCSMPPPSAVGISGIQHGDDVNAQRLSNTSRRGTMQAIVDLAGSTSPPGDDIPDKTLDTILKSAFDQAVDAIRAHADWRPARDPGPDLFGDSSYALDGKLITELAWIFGAEGDAPIPFEAAADAAEMDPGRFRRACQRAFPRECAWIEANVGPLQGV